MTDIKPKFERKAPIKPKHRKVFKYMAQGDTKKDAILKAGYTMATAEHPQEIIKTKSFQQILKNKIKDDKLVEVLNDGLEAQKPYGKDGFLYEDHATRHKFLETGLKLKGHTIEEKEKNQVINIAVILDKLEDNKTINQTN